MLDYLSKEIPKGWFCSSGRPQPSPGDLPSLSRLQVSNFINSTFAQWLKLAPLKEQWAVRSVYGLQLMIMSTIHRDLQNGCSQVRLKKLPDDDWKHPDEQNQPPGDLLDDWASRHFFNILLISEAFYQLCSNWSAEILLLTKRDFEFDCWRFHVGLLLQHHRMLLQNTLKCIL